MSLVILLTGVSGAGKTAVGRRLAERRGVAFLDGDDLHPERNIRKMASGRPLTDDDREPWLLALRRALEQHVEAGSSAVVACSALKSSYRAVLLAGLPSVTLVHLRAGREVLERRLAARRDHFFPPSLLASQLAALEEPTEAIVVDAEQSIETVVAAIESALDPTQG